MQVAVPLVLVLTAALLGKQHVENRSQLPLPVDPMHAVAGWPGVVAGSLVRSSRRMHCAFVCFRFRLHVSRNT
jgi:hypothetical protein